MVGREERTCVVSSINRVLCTVTYQIKCDYCDETYDTKPIIVGVLEEIPVTTPPPGWTTIHSPPCTTVACPNHRIEIITSYGIENPRKVTIIRRGNFTDEFVDNYSKSNVIRKAMEGTKDEKDR